MLRAGVEVPGEPLVTRDLPACRVSPRPLPLHSACASPPLWSLPAFPFPCHPPVMNTTDVKECIPFTFVTLITFFSKLFCRSVSFNLSVTPPPFTLYIRSRSLPPIPLLPSSSPARKIIIALTCQAPHPPTAPFNDPAATQQPATTMPPLQQSCNTPKPASSAVDQGSTREIQDPVRGVRGRH